MKSTRLALTWSLTERYVSLFVTLVSSIVIARLLTPEEIGKFSLCAAVLAIAATLRDFGISEYLIQARNLDRQRQRSALTITLAIAWSIGGLLFLVRQPLARFYQTPELEGIIAVLSLNFVLLPLATGAFALLSREMAFRKIFLLQTAASLAQALTSIGFAMAGHGALSLAWGSVAGATTQVLLLAVLRPGSVLMWPSLQHATEVIRYGLLAVSGRLIDTATGNAHEFIIAHRFDFTAVGLFSKAIGLVDMFSKNVTVAATRVAMPAMANTHREGKSLLRDFALGTCILTGVSWPFFLFLGLTAPEIVRVMFGPQWDLAGQLAIWLCLSMLPSSLYALGPATLAAMGLVGKRLKISMAFGPVHVGLLLLAVASGELLAMAAIYCISHMFLLVLHTRALQAALKARASELYSASVSSAKLTLLICLVTTPTVLFLRWIESPALLVLVGAALVSLPVWYASLGLLSHPLRTEVDRALRTMYQMGRSKRA